MGRVLGMRLHEFLASARGWLERLECAAERAESWLEALLAPRASASEAKAQEAAQEQAQAEARDDAPLEVGGYPRGALTELSGEPSSGKSTRALAAVAAAHRAGLDAIYFDCDRTFESRYAAGLGVDLERLVLARPERYGDALEMAARLARSGVAELIVLDAPWTLAGERTLDAARRLAAAVEESGCALLLLARGGREGWQDGEPLFRPFCKVRLSLST